MTSPLPSLLEKAITLRHDYASQGSASRTYLYNTPYESTFRLFNGFHEGYPKIKYL